MKKIILIIAAVLFSFSSFSQKLDNQFYFRFGYSNPSWSQFGMEKDDWGDNISKIGAHFDLGSIFMIQPWSAENIALGVNVDYLYLTYGNFSVEEYGYSENFGYARLGSKVGPSFTYSPVNKMAIDVYMKADFAWATAAVLYEDEVGDAEDYYTDPFSVGFSTGLNFRYGVLILGMEFNTISPKLESDDHPGNYLGNFGDYLDDDYHMGEEGDKSKMPCMNFTIGLSF